MNQNPWWKSALVAAVLLGAFLVALPNVFGEAPAVQISPQSGARLDQGGMEEVKRSLETAGVAFGSAYDDNGRLMLRFDSVEEQLRAADRIRESLGQSYVVALTLAPRTPGWLTALGLRPMSLGLDLRGGVHFLFQVDMQAALQQRVDRYATDFAKLLRDNRIRRDVRVDGNVVRIEIPDPKDADRAEKLIRDSDPQIGLERRNEDGAVILLARMTEQQIRERQDFAIEQNTVTLRNRVNELGVSEPVVQRQGLDRIVVQLPGVQDPAQAERVLGATATLEFRLVCADANPVEAKRKGRAPIGCELHQDRQGNPVLLQRRTIVTGDQLIDAAQAFDQGMPAVSVRLDSQGGREMLDVTKKNLNKPMAVLFVETKRERVERDGQVIEVPREEREVINVATIRGIFSNNFQITGLDVTEARDLALLLRAGALAAPVYKVEERTIGPSLGQDNIDKGMQALVLGLVLVVLFMGVYYKAFGLVANVALIANVVLLVALLSMLQASLTLPGIAGVVLTVGMAVDANVLINERIREELRNGNSPQASIHAGYDKAIATIADSNLTTLIAGIVLFAFGTGPIKGFAIVLCLGILTSMFTAVVVSRTLVNAIWGGRRLTRLPV
ncbi:MAG: protein translocase subunit SecD [Gammaproteobacteria bacterium]|nr:MAG: protein translocase subunit SecD [Gammaproteobacteria bacterium]